MRSSITVGIRHLATSCAAGLVLEVRIEERANVAEVASVGGSSSNTKSCSIRIACARSASPSIGEVCTARSNNETGGSVLELGEAEYAVRATGYLKNLDDFRTVRSGLG